MKTPNHQTAGARKQPTGRWVSRRGVPAHDSPAHLCVLGLLATGREVRAALAKRMAVEVFSEAQLAILVALLAADPSSASVGTLSCQTGVGFRHLILAIDSLMAHNLLEEDPDRVEDCHGVFRLTRRGRETAVVAAHLFLEAVDELTCGLTATQFVVLEESFKHLTDRARRLWV